MALHLIKLSVGSESVDTLAAWQAERMKRHGRLWHATRMMPKRSEELLDGGSIYWVIKGLVQARQGLIGIEPAVDAQGRRQVLLLLDADLRRVVPTPHRAFQGWRYLRPEAAPPDLGGAGDDDALPPELLGELKSLGIL